MNKLINCVLLIDTFEHKCFVLKGILQSSHIKYQMKTIGIDQILRNSALFEHICLKDINKLYKHAGKFDDKQQLKDILEDAMVYTPGGFTNNTTISPIIQPTLNKPKFQKITV